MRLLLSLLMSLSFTTLFSQFGVIDFSTKMHYSNLIVHNDTLVLAAETFPDAVNPQGILLVKMDTLGNPYFSKTHYGKNGNGYLLNSLRSRNLIRISDGSGYLLMATDIDNWVNNLFIKFDNKGDIIWEQEHLDSLSIVDFIVSITEIEDGFLLAGRMQLESDLSLETFLIKISKEGKVLWRKTYGVPNLDEAGMGLIKIDSDKFALFGNRSRVGVPINDPQVVF